MFVASSAQFEHVLQATRNTSDGDDSPSFVEARTRLLDVGAGDGTVTRKLARALKIRKPGHVVAVESSAPLR